MITCEDGKKIFRIGFQKALISFISAVLLSLFGGVGIGFRIAYNDHFTLKDNVAKVSAMQTTIEQKVDSNTYKDDQKKETDQLNRIEGKIDTLSQNLFIHINGSIR